MSEHKYKLTDTLVRELTEEKDWMIARLKKVDFFNYSIELTEEPGEVLITRMMSQEDIEEAVTEAIKEILPNKKVSDILSEDKFLCFKISN